MEEGIDGREWSMEKMYSLFLALTLHVKPWIKAWHDCGVIVVSNMKAQCAFHSVCSPVLNALGFGFNAKHRY